MISMYPVHRPRTKHTKRAHILRINRELKRWYIMRDQAWIGTWCGESDHIGEQFDHARTYYYSNRNARRLHRKVSAMYLAWYPAYFYIRVRSIVLQARYSKIGA